jgi:Bacterial Ig-like domain (group 3)
MRAKTLSRKMRRRKELSLDLLELRQLLATINVNTTADSTTAGATLSLRQAIEVSNGTHAVSSLSTQQQALVSGTVGSSNTIDFRIPTTDAGYNQTTGVWTISLNSSLPEINTNAAMIDGYSQPGSAKNTLAQADNAKLLIVLDGAGGASTGLTIAAQGSKVSGLDIENFNGDGVLITAGGGVQVAGCFIGMGPTGETAASNKTGVEIENSNNLIGGPGVGDRNVISGNTSQLMSGVGVYVPDQAHNPLNITPSANVIENNFIGLDAKGTTALGNGLTSLGDAGGVADSGSGDIYGGTAPGLGNVISGNGYGGINSTGSITIEGNYIGTDATDNVGVGNGGYVSGITNISPSGAAVTVTISNNVVSGNEGGILLQPGAPSTSTYTISNNLIGTNAAGTAALGNARDGLQMFTVENSTITNNVISANQVGVELISSGSTLLHDVFQGNFVGTDKTGLVDLGNTEGGITLTGPSATQGGHGNLLGGTGPGQGNVIAFNNGPGIYLAGGGQFDTFTRNSIYNNNGPGIEESIGPTGVAPGLLNFAPGTGGNGLLSGTFYEQPNQTYTVEIYSNPQPPAGGHAEGKTFVQDVTVTTDGTGTGTFSLTLPQGLYTSTATNSAGSTSGFSVAVGAPGLPATTTVVTSSSNPSNLGEQVTFTAAVTASGFAGTPTGTVTFTIDGQAQAPLTLSVVGGVDQAQYNTGALAAGQHTVSAAYSGDSNVGPSSVSLPSQVVNGPTLKASTTTLSSSANPSTVGQQVTFTAVVSAASYQGTPTGTVTFTIDGHTQSPAQLAFIGGQDEATFTTSTLAAGQHSVTAAYSGDTHVSSSSGSLPTEVVNARNLQATTTVLASSLNPSTVGQPVSFTAIVSPSGTAEAPSGSVTFTIDGVSKAPVPLQVVNGRDQATLSIASLAKGTHTVTAAYSGDASFAASALASPLVETVKAVTVPPPAVDGPKVELVQRFGVHMQPTVLVVTFNEALDPASAVNLNNYRITDPAGRSVRISSAIFDATTNTVTLRPVDRINLHHTYQLRLIGTGPGGIRNTRGELLDGANTGNADSDYTANLTWRNVVLTPAQARKYDHPSQAKPAGALHHRFLRPSH